MLEEGSHLLTWRLSERPTEGSEIPLIPLAPHRLIYLEYEGPISRNRGQVWREDGGNYEWVSRSVAEWQINFFGRWLIGQASLRDSENGWLFCWNG